MSKLQVSNDSLRRFVFEDKPIRGAWVSLDSSIQALYTKQQGYPALVRGYLNECLAASVLLSSVIKLDGSLSLQARGDGKVTLFLAQAQKQQEQRDIVIRGIARLAEGFAATNEADVKIPSLSLSELLGQGHLVVSIEPQQGQMYQGYVELKQGSLASNIQAYFSQSEQLATYFQFASTNNRSVGFMLQRMPSSAREDEQQCIDDDEDWQHCLQLSNTLEADELLAHDDETILYRLFHNERLKLFEPQAITFKCSCSYERTMKALRSIGQDEVKRLLKEMPQIKMGCEFCGKDYVFDINDYDTLFDTPFSDLVN